MRTLRGIQGFLAGQLMSEKSQHLFWATTFALMLLSTACATDATRQEDWRDPELKSLVISAPSWEGQYYEAEVPDTLDLTERAELSISAITSLLNPSYDYTQFTFVEYRTDPPAAIMGHGGLTNLNPKWMESLPLLRIMTGSTQNRDIDPRLVESLVHITGEDGLAYQPPEHPGAFYDEFTRERGKPAADMFGEGRFLLALSVWSQLSTDPLYKSLAERKIKRLSELAVPHNNGLYFRRGRGYSPGEENTDQLEIYAITDHDVADPNIGMVGTAAFHTMGTAAMGAGRYYAVTGYPPALELAKGAATYLKDHAKLVDDDGKWHGWHFHIVAAGLLGVLEYATAANDREVLEWVQRSYEYGKSIGDPMLGFFAGIPGCERCEFNPNAEECGRDHQRTEVEPCSISDMLLIALKLTHAGLGNYYEDVEYYLRNLFVETQITNLDFLESLPGQLSEAERKKAGEILGNYALDPRQVSTERAAERGVGSFVCSRPNQWYIGGLPGPQACGCCLGNGARILYYIWDSILQSEDENLRVNLLLNRASPWADVSSYLPYQGKVVLDLKQRKNLFVRIPDWVNKKRVSCSVNGKRRTFKWDGSYIAVGSAQPEDQVVVTFPIVERTLTRDIKSQQYEVTFRGFTAVDLQPGADVTPLFQRAHYRSSRAPMKKVRRFVTEQKISW